MPITVITFVFAVLVAILDTGVHAAHAHFAQTVVMGDVVDACGHGTAMAGIVVDLAPHADILSIDVDSNDDCRSSHTDIAAAIQQAADQGADVAVVAWRVSPSAPLMIAANAYAALHGTTVVFSDGLTPMTRSVPNVKGGYKWIGGTSTAAAYNAGLLAFMLGDIQQVYLPAIEVY